MRIGGAGKEKWARQRLKNALMRVFQLAFTRFDAAPAVEMRFLNTL